MFLKKKNHLTHFKKFSLNLKSTESSKYESWLYKSSIINASTLEVNFEHVISESISSCDKLKEFGRKYGLKLDFFEITIRQRKKSLQILNNGFGFESQELFKFLKSICKPSLLKNKEPDLFYKTKPIRRSIYREFSQPNFLGFVTKKIGSEYSFILEIDTKNGRVLLSKFIAYKSSNYTFLNFFDDKKLFNLSFTRNLQELIKKYIFKTDWLRIRYINLNKENKINVAKKPKIIERMKKPSFIYSSIKFTKKEEYLELFYKINFKWNYPLCMLHLLHFPNLRIDVIFFIPRYLKSNPYFKNHMLFIDTNRYKQEQLESLFFLEKITPEWCFFGIGIVKLREKKFEEINLTEELILKKKISLKMTELLSNLSLKNSSWYAFFWITYGYKLKIKIMKKKAMLHNFSHLLRFFSTKSKNSLISIEDYVKNMNNLQKEIYYFPVSRNIFYKNHPSLEKLIKNNIEVLLLFDSIDESLIEVLNKNNSTTKRGRFFFKKIGSFEFSKNHEMIKKNYLDKNWKPEICLKWFSNEFSTKFFKIENSHELYNSSSNFIFFKNYPYNYFIDSQKLVKNYEKKNFFLSKRQYIIFEINGANNLIRILNKYLSRNTTVKTTKEIGILVWETTSLKCGIFLSNEKNFIKRIENFLTIFILIIYSKKNVNDKN